MEARVCLKKSSFPELPRDIAQRHLSSSGSDISFISGRQAPPTLRKYANDQLSLVRLLELKDGANVRVSQIEAATAIWSQPKGRRCERSASPKARMRFVNHAVRWLRFLSWLDEADEARHRHGAEIEVYEAWMRDDRGLSEETIRDYRDAADQFFDWLTATDIPLASVKITDIDDAITDKKARGTCGRRAMHDYAQRLRAFFRFAEVRGWCTPGMANGIMPPRFKRDEAVPKGLRRDDVLRLLATTEGDRLVDKRDRAILMLFIAYGLRAGEVGGLRLDDLDWENEMLRVRCPKPGRTHTYPLSRGVGDAILRYIREVRPSGFGRALFFTMRAPIRPLGRRALGKIVRDRLAALGNRRQGTERGHRTIPNHPSTDRKIVRVSVASSRPRKCAARAMRSTAESRSLAVSR
jgi:site-specific recombinase XerD